MKFSWFSRLLLSAVISVSLFSCSKDDDDVVTPPTQQNFVAGKGGNATLRVVPLHNKINIDSCTIYLKYNALDMPSSYDETIYCTVDAQNEFAANFTNLKKGNYFIYAKGWDIYTSQTVENYLYHIVTDESALQTIRLDLRVK